MSGETVLVAATRLDEPMRRLVVEACDHARVRPVFWSGNGPGEPSLDPSLLVAALPMGQRSIPEDVALLSAQTFHGLPLLLLCGEPLVRHSVSLQRGRVTLLGAPLTREKISARIRTAVAGRAASGSDSGKGVERVSDNVLVREFRGREWWAGAIARDPRRGLRGVDAGELFPSVAKLGRHGLAGLLPLDTQEPLPAPALHQAAVGLVSAMTPDRTAAALEAAVGSDAAMAWFSPSTSRWSFYLPQPAAELWLSSPMRIPSPWRMSTDGRGPWWTIPAASGDLVFLSVGVVQPGELRDPALLEAADSGGPALLDVFESRLAHREAAGAALIVELR